MQDTVINVRQSFPAQRTDMTFLTFYSGIPLPYLLHSATDHIAKSIDNIADNILAVIDKHLNQIRLYKNIQLISAIEFRCTAHRPVSPDIAKHLPAVRADKISLLPDQKTTDIKALPGLHRHLYPDRLPG